MLPHAHVAVVTEKVRVHPSRSVGGGEGGSPPLHGSFGAAVQTQKRAVSRTVTRNPWCHALHGPGEWLYGPTAVSETGCIRLETRTKEFVVDASVVDCNTTPHSEGKLPCRGVPPQFSWRDGEREHPLHAPKDGDLLIARLKSAETLMAGRGAPDVQIGRKSCVKRRKTHRTV